MSASKALSPEQQVQEDLLRLDAYRAQFNALAQQHQILSASRIEHTRARETLEGLERVGSEPDLLVPLGAETFVHGSVRADGKVLIGLGSGIVTEMERARAQEIVAQRILQIEQATRELETNLQTLEDRIGALSARVEAAGRAGQNASSAEGRSPDDVGSD
jgi:prefoldin alpha subunit